MHWKSPAWRIYRTRLKPYAHILQQQQIVSLVIVPISVGGTIGGGIGFDHVLETRRWTAEDLGLLHTAADIIAAALQRQQIAVALRNSEQKFSNAFEASPDAITLTALADGRLVEANAAFERMLMWSREEAIGQTIRELGLWAESSDRERLLHHVETQSIVEQFRDSAAHPSREDDQCADFLAADGDERSNRTCCRWHATLRSASGANWS